MIKQDLASKKSGQENKGIIRIEVITNNRGEKNVSH
jgi:hypothetical protein